MFDVMMWLIMIPVVVMAICWWVRAAKWTLKNKRTLGQKMERVKTVLNEAGDP